MSARHEAPAIFLLVALALWAISGDVAAEQSGLCAAKPVVRIAKGTCSSNTVPYLVNGAVASVDVAHVVIVYRLTAHIRVGEHSEMDQITWNGMGGAPTEFAQRIYEVSLAGDVSLQSRSTVLCRPTKGPPQDGDWRDRPCHE